MATYPSDTNFSEFEFNEEDHVSNNIYQFYFVKVYNNANAEIKLKQAEKLIEEINRRRIPLRDEYYTLRNAHLELDCLRIRESNFVDAVGWKEEKLDKLQSALDKLNFAKNVTYSRDCDDFRSIRHRMIHGRGNSAKEKKLLKQMAGSQHADIDSSKLLESVKHFVEWFYKLRHFGNLKRYENIVKEIKHLEDQKEKSMANASAKGKMLSPRISTRTILDHINLINRISEEMRKDHWELIVEIKRLEKCIKAGKDISVLRKQLDDVNREMLEAQKYVRNVRDRYEEANVGYHENVSVLSQARELARKKDAAGLEQLSRREVDKFMYQWNSSKSFRDSYKKRMMPSLKNRQLNGDGRCMMKNTPLIVASMNQNDYFLTQRNCKGIEVDKYMYQWDGIVVKPSKLRDSYEKRMMPSLNDRHLSARGRTTL